jgi:hypothetical protein
MERVIASWYAKTTLKDLKRHQLMARQSQGQCKWCSEYVLNIGLIIDKIKD